MSRSNKALQLRPSRYAAWPQLSLVVMWQMEPVGNLLTDPPISLAASRQVGAVIDQAVPVNASLIYPRTSVGVTFEFVIHDIRS